MCIPGSPSGSLFPIFWFLLSQSILQLTAATPLISALREVSGVDADSLPKNPVTTVGYRARESTKDDGR